MPNELTGVRTQIANSVENTLLREARRNESVIAVVRAGLLGVAAAIEIWWATAYGDDPNSVAFVFRLPLILYFFAASAYVMALKRGWYHRLVEWLVPVLDAAVLGLRFQASFSLRSTESLALDHELATVFGIAAALVLTGAFRMSRRSTYVSFALGVALYIWFAAQVDLLPAQMLVHVAILTAVGLLAAGLASKVQSSVRSHVARLTLSRLLPQHVIDGAHADPVAMLGPPRAIDATVFVIDIRGFTTWAEKRSPTEVLEYLNVVLGTCADVVRRNGGVVDKFLGDGMFAVFGAPDGKEGHANLAIEAAHELLQTVETLRTTVEGAEGLDIGIGVHSGELVIGFVGSGLRLEFTTIGDTVNTAFRLEALNKEFGQVVLVSGDTASRLSDPSALKAVGDTDIRGRKERLEVFTLA